MKRRQNRSLSSVKSLAPYFLSLRTRHAKSYDFVCRCCGTTLQPEKQVFELLEALFQVAEGGTETDRSIGVFIEEWEEMRRHGMPLPSYADRQPRR